MTSTGPARRRRGIKCGRWRQARPEAPGPCDQASPLAARRGRFVIPLVAAAALVSAGCGPDRSDDVLSPRGRAAYRQGVSALEARQWSLAIRHLREVEIEPRPYPPLLRALALAHAGAGEGVLAIAWAQAYLAAAHPAAEAGTIRTELERLEAAERERARDLLRQALTMVDSLTDKLARDRNLSVLAQFTAVAGDVTEALEIERRKEVDAPDKARVWAAYAEGLAREGDVKAAQQVLAQRLSHAGDGDGVYHALVGHFLLVEGDAGAARAFAAEIRQPQRREGALAFIAQEERGGRLSTRSRTTVLSVVRQAQSLSALHDRRRAAREPTRRENPDSQEWALRRLAEEALFITNDLRELRVRAQRITCCLERP